MSKFIDKDKVLEYIIFGTEEFNYCPNCGAKIKG